MRGVLVVRRFLTPGGWPGADEQIEYGRRPSPATG